MSSSEWWSPYSRVYFTDGACSGNPGPAGWGCIVLDISRKHFLELGGFEAQSTNNRMEMQSVFEALKDFAKISSGDERALVILDSEYVRKGLVEWIPNWKKRGWKKADGGDVLNQDIWENLEALYRPLARKVDFKIVKGHAGIAGNERADAIAVDFSKGGKPTLHSNSWDEFDGDWRDLGDASTVAQAKKSKKKAPKNGFYLSALGKNWLRHDTWPECASRVQGVSGAKFKKVKDDAEAHEVLKSWGISS